ncbi:MAG: thermosome subunit beta [Candidatus Helarchaeota archaeon]
MSQIGSLGGQPVIILKEGTNRTRGKDASRVNIMAAKVIAEAVKSTLGPKGMDKMLVDSLGDVVITNDGATILDEIDVQHPAAKMLVDVAKTQDDEVGDGTTTATILAGELLKLSEDLLDQGIHPTTIVSGLKKGGDKAREIVEQIAIEVDINDKEILKKCAKTSMNSKSISMGKDYFADIAVDAVDQIKEKRGDKWVVDIDQIQIQKKQGKSVMDTELIKGIIIDKEVVHSAMPKKVENAKILLIDSALEIEKTEFDAEIRITDPAQMQQFLDEEERMLKSMIDKVIEVGANVVFCQKGIDDVAQHFLAKNKILAVRRVKKSDMEKLKRATGANIISNIEDLTSDDLGSSAKVEEKKVGSDKMVFIEGCKDPKAVSILIRGGVEHLTDEAERSLHDALCVVADIIENNKIVPGGGAPEIEVAMKLREFSASVGGREQLAIDQLASALEVIPKTLSENAGLDPIDILVELREKHSQPSGVNYGVDVFSGKASDMVEMGIIEPLVIKLQAIKSAIEAASMILRIDDVIAAKASSGPPGGGGGMPGGMPGGMGGMGGYGGMPPMM